MTRYEQVKSTIRSLEHTPREGVRDFLLVVDVPDHRHEASAVHVDAARAALDWFCERHPDHPICLASASRHSTRRAWEEFGYAHLPKEYPHLRLLDLNEHPLPSSTLTLHLRSDASLSWSAYHARPERVYTPEGHVWERNPSCRPSGQHRRARQSWAKPWTAGDEVVSAPAPDLSVVVQ